MICPKSIRIAGVTIKVVRQDLDGDPYGSWSLDSRTIVIDQGLKGKKLHDTLRHEMVHAAWALGGVAWCESMEEEALNRCLDECFWPAWERVCKRLTK
jgi:hypothetical protein